MKQRFWLLRFSICFYEIEIAPKRIEILQSLSELEKPAFHFYDLYDLAAVFCQHKHNLT